MCLFGVDSDDSKRIGQAEDVTLAETIRGDDCKAKNGLGTIGSSVERCSVSDL